MGIHLTQKEVNALMKKLDLNLDGEVSADEIINVLHSVSGSPSAAKKSGNQVDLAISKLVQSGRIFSNMRDYAVHLIKKWDRDNDGIITFSELCDGLSKMSITLSNADKQGLMHRLDIDRDGRITSDEIFRVLSGGDAAGMVDATIKKIASGAAKYGSMQEYVKDLVRRFDRNSDGLLSIKELTEGLAKMQIYLSQSETQALMNKLDLNRDGEVSAEEIFKVLSQGSSGSFKSSGVDQAIKKLAEGSSRFPSMYDYSRYLIKQFDHDNDGIITFAELCNGLNKLKIPLMPSDKQGLM
jgi:Ca2+-binding EF-hand superfamily protein